MQCQAFDVLNVDAQPRSCTFHGDTIVPIKQCTEPLQLMLRTTEAVEVDSQSRDPQFYSWCLFKYIPYTVTGFTKHSYIFFRKVA